MPAVCGGSHLLHGGVVLSVPGTKASQRLGKVLTVNTSPVRAVKSANGVGLGLLRGPGTGAEIVNRGAVPQSHLRHVNADLPGKPHNSELIDLQPGKSAVRRLEDPVTVLPVGRDDEPVSVTAHRELQRHAGQ